MKDTTIEKKRITREKREKKRKKEKKERKRRKMMKKEKKEKKNKMKGKQFVSKIRIEIEEVRNEKMYQRRENEEMREEQEMRKHIVGKRRKEGA